MLVTPLLTERLRIRRFTPDDWPAVYLYTSDPVAMRFLPERVMSEEETRLFIAENGGEDSRIFAVDLLEENRLIGHMTFHPWFASRIYEIGWIINPRYHGHGYATEAAQALLRHGFDSLGVHRIIATCQPENPASWRVMEKLGMAREGHFRQCIERDDGVWWGEYFYAILAEDWQRMHGTAG